MSGTNVRVTTETHAKVIQHLEGKGLKLSFFVDKALLEKIERESKKKKAVIKDK